MNSQRIHTVDVTARNLKVNARLSLKDQQLRNNMRSAMDSLISKRIISMPDDDERENLRELGNKVRARALSELPDLLELLEANLTKQGIQVHWANSTDEANAIVLKIAQTRNAKQVIKGKSMVSEEMAMNE
ncbi:MAG TPA: (Fe-S)-binding protein, partial [Pseudomonas sp.]|nr:(Fe-S)-binding protein [Pseudomonas sp.]